MKPSPRHADLALADRVDAIEAALGGRAGGLDPRVATWLERVGDRFRRAHKRLAGALAATRCLDAAALRLLEADPDPFEDHVLHDPRALARFVRIASQSTRYGRLVAADPTLVTGTDRASSRATAQIAEAVHGARAGRADATVDAMRAGLRRRRVAVLLDVLDDEVTGRRSLESTAADVTRLAERSIADALAFAIAEVGVDAAAVAVIGMGKLGAGELNPASDVDLVFVATPEAGDVTAVVRRVADLLETRTDDGQVFRVDLRLRPFGGAGPVAVTPAGLGEYFERHAQPWERGVWAKARVVAGATSLGEDAIRRSTPFVWRRTIDQASIDELAAMKSRVQQRARAGAADHWDVKHGDGGIREVEFFVQTLVLVAGGRDPSMRVASTPDALARLTGAGLIDERDHFALLDAWRFLRRIEHRVQLDEERQTHRVPLRGAAADRLARRLDYDDAAALHAAVHARTAPVRTAWAALLAGRDAPTDTATAAPPLTERLVDPDVPLDRRYAAARDAGFIHAERVVRDLQRLAAPPSPLIGPWAERHDAVRVTRLVDACVASVAPDRAFERVRAALERSGARGTLLRVADRPATTRVLVTLFAASQDVGRALARGPGLLDDLIAGVGPRTLDDRLAEQLAAADADDGGPFVERRLERLRRFRTFEQARVVLAMIGGRMDVFEATRELTAVAERCVEATGRLAEAEVRGSEAARRHGVIAFGKLGAGELGHGADLDLVFVYDGRVDEIAEFAAIARRHVGFLSTPMAWGRMYSVDLRLRPDGGQGTLVTPWSAFAGYYADRARPWEHVALLRSRPLHPDAALADRARGLVARSLETVDVDVARAELAELRLQRIAGAHDDDVKDAAGGLADLEHLVVMTALQARRAGQWRGGWDPRTDVVLDRLAAIGVLRTPIVARLRDALQRFRTVEQWLRVSEGDEVSRLPAVADRRRVVERRVVRALPDAGGDLTAVIAGARAVVLEALAEAGWPGV